MADDAPGDGLTLDVVKQRFVDAERTLTELTERLRRLQAAEAESVKAAQTLSEAGEALSRYVSAAELTASEFVKLQEAAREAVASASALLQGDEVRRLGQELEQLRSSMTGQLSAIEERLDEAERARSEANRLNHQLEALRNQLPARWRKKLKL